MTAQPSPWRKPLLRPPGARPGPGAYEEGGQRPLRAARVKGVVDDLADRDHRVAGRQLDVEEAARPKLRRRGALARQPQHGLGPIEAEHPVAGLPEGGGRLAAAAA